MSAACAAAELVDTDFRDHKPLASTGPNAAGAAPAAPVVEKEDLTSSLLSVISVKTEIADMNNTLSPVQQRFVLHWGEMGTRWGINRTVAQIHALLYTSAKPRHAEDIATTLGVARSNVSTSLKELQGWGIVKRVHVLGDARDHYESLKDVWEMFRAVLDERKKREIDPTLAVLRECIVEAEKDEATDAYTEQKLRELAGFFETCNAWYGQIRSWPASAVVKFVKLGDKARRFLG